MNLFVIRRKVDYNGVAVTNREVENIPPDYEKERRTTMTIKEASALYGVSTQAIYKRLTKKGYDIKQLKDSTGALTEEGERIIEELFDRTTVTGEGDPTPQPDRKEATKAEEPPVLQDNQEVERLKAEVARLQTEVDSLRDERDYLRRALDQAQQLHAMTMRMLPPAPAERQGVFSWLASRFKRPAQQAPEQTSGDA